MTASDFNVPASSRIHVPGYLFEAGPRLEQGLELSSCLSSELYPSATWNAVPPQPTTLPHTSRMRQAIDFWITKEKPIFSEGFPSCLACLRASEALCSYLTSILILSAGN